MCVVLGLIGVAAILSLSGSATTYWRRAFYPPTHCCYPITRVEVLRRGTLCLLLLGLLGSG